MAAFKFLGSDSGRLPQIDRYELVAEIASGGMATVYLARTLGMGGFERFFAIKRLHPHLGSEEAFVQMFLDEARLVAGIRHQHVVPVLEVGAGEAGYYLVMEYVEGETLGSLLAKSVKSDRPVPAAAAIKIVLDTLSGLHAAHELLDPDGSPVGLVHRDVSPQNILIDVNGVTRIADFGVAHAHSRLGSTRAGQLKGKVAYMAPEQARGELVTRRADVFAAGIVLWEALSLKRLFMCDTDAATLNRLIFEPIPRLREGNAAMPSALDKVVGRALERDPARRYATAADFAEALETAARASRMLGSTNDVKSFVADAAGGQINDRKDAIRQHLVRLDQLWQQRQQEDEAAAEPSSESTSSVNSAAMAMPASSDSGDQGQDDAEATGSAQAAPSRKRWPYALGAVVLGVAVVLAVMSRKEISPTEAAPASPTTQASRELDEPRQIAPAASQSSPVEAEEAPPPAASVSVPRGRVPGPLRTASAPVAPPPPPSTAVVPPAATDDLKLNPYR